MHLLNKVALAGFIVTLLASLVGFWGFWKLVTYQISTSVNLAPGSDVRKAWEKAPIALDFNVFVFNITNPMEVQNGSKPIIQEIGPFAFFEWKEKANIVDHENNDTVSFNMKTTWMFNAEGSGGLTMNETVVVPHAMMMGLVYMVEKRKPGSLRVVNRALPGLFNKPETPFVATSVYDFLFGGLVINCTSKEFAVAALCTFIRGQADTLHKVSDDIYKFSLFGVKNGTPEAGRFNVNRGTEDHNKVGKVELYNHEPRMYVWDGPECNQIMGTDSTVFPPLQDPMGDIISFTPDMCRSLGAKFTGMTDYRGFSVSSYNASLGDMSTNLEEKCFCPSPETCLKKGALDLTECLESPIIVTLPHFYDADPSYLEAVEGVQPDDKKHQILLLFEPITGTPLSARKRLQFNMHLHAIQKVTIMANLPDALMPLFWVEEGVDLEGELLHMLDRSLFRPLRWVSVGRWVLISIGLIMIVGAIAIKYIIQNDMVTTYFDQQPRHPVPRKSRSPTQVMDLSPAKY